MRRSVTKTIRFEAAHRLCKGYIGDCAHIHGHTWIAEITVSSRANCDSTLDEHGKIRPLHNPSAALDECDFLMELSAINAVRDWVNRNFDHSLMLNSDDPLVPILKEHGNVYDKPARLFEFSHQNPTLEVISEKLLQIAVLRINDERVFVSKVVLHETPQQFTTIEVVG